MGDGGLLSLSWNNHKATFCHILSTLREKERYTDVTLACEGKFYPVHKLVLSTCSEYFESMFEQTPCKHPIIVLKDLKSDEVESLLSYMYAGVVNVAQTDLARLIKAAEFLKVKGLAVPDEPPQEERKNSSPSHSSRDDRLSPHPKRRRRDDSDGLQSGDHGANATSPSVSPRHSPYHTSSEYHHDNSRTTSEGHVSEHRTEKSIDRIEHDVRSDTKPAGDLNTDQHNPAKQSSPLQVMLDETLVKEEIMDPLPEDQDNLMSSGMDYGSLASESRLENSTSDANTQDHQGQLLSAKYEQQQPLGPSQSHHLPDAVVEALAGPSGMQGWLGGSEMGGAFSGVDSYGGDSRHQELRQPLPSQQPQAHQMEGVEIEKQEKGRKGRPRLQVLVESAEQTRHRRGGMATGRAGTTLKSHRCTYCDYTTYFTTNLRNHMRRHTGEKPYSCQQCPYSAITKQRLERHMQTHMRGTKCPTCTFVGSREEMKMHICSAHGMKLW